MASKKNLSQLELQVSKKELFRPNQNIIVRKTKKVL